jgi:hypothetical protein
MLINQAESQLKDTDGNKDLLTVENEYWVTMHDALERLEQNEDFKKVIQIGYFKDKAVNGVSLLATDYVKQAGARGDIMEQLVAISQLEDYFAVIHNLGTVPTDAEDDEE